MTKLFVVPKDGGTYIRTIFARTEALISQNIWQGVDIVRFKQWLKNFSTLEEKYFAACLLDSVIYRSEEQTKALVRQLFERVLPDLIRLDKIPLTGINNCIEYFREFPINCDLRFVVVQSKMDSSTASAPTIARLIRRTCNFDSHWFEQSVNITKIIAQGAKVIFFVDDFLGTGTQFLEFFDDFNLRQHLSTLYFAYLPLVAHENGINNLKSILPGLRVKAVETLDNTHCLFHKNSNYFSDGTNDTESALEFYYGLLKKMNIDDCGTGRRGFGCMGLSYFLKDATPDNCLPIFWHPETLFFKPLFTE